MLRDYLSSPLTTVCLGALLSVSCASRDKSASVEEVAPPPAAYPESSGNYAGSPAPAPSSVAPAPPSPSSASVASSTRPSPAPPAFKLREGEQLVDYKIQMGDSLGKIATKMNSSVRRIQLANGMTGDRIYAGKMLKVPTSAPPGGLAMNTATAASTGYDAPARPDAPSVSPYGGTTTIAPPSVPSSAPIQIPSSPSSTSYPPTTAPAPPQTSGGFPTPSFGGSSDIQFSQ